MWSYLKSLSSFFWTDSGQSEELTVEEKEEEILNVLNLTEDLVTSELEGFGELKTEERTGVITRMSGNSGFIDDIYPFYLTYSSGNIPAEKDSVKFTLYYNDLHSIVQNIEKIAEDTSVIHNHDDSLNETNPGNSKTLSGQVYDRHKRTFYVKLDSNELVKFDLNCVTSDFIPALGDFVDMDVIDESNINKPECVNVIKVRPKKIAMRMGTVTSLDNRYGTISDFAIFTLSACETGFNPGIGCKVCASVIRSDCIYGFLWRAINVIPGDNVSSIQEQKNVEEEMRNKRGILISVSPKFSLMLYDEFQFKVQVTNKCTSKRHFSVRSGSQSRQNQVKLVHPVDKNILIKDDEVLECVFKIYGKFVGRSCEHFIWDFGGFVIRRIISFDVQIPKDQVGGSILPAPDSKVFFQNSFSRTVTAKNIVGKMDGNIIPGIKKIKPSFIPVKTGNFQVPTILIETILPESKIPLHILRNEIENYLPCLKTGLKPDTYAQYMHSLIYFEEIHLLQKVAQLDIDNASFKKYLTYLILDVPENSVYTKLFMPGDFALVSLPWDKHQKMQGIIKKVTKSEIWMMFSKDFHDKYIEGSCYFTSFVTSRAQLRRIHQAIDLAEKYLGSNWLFPSCVSEKCPQVKFVEHDEVPTADNEVSHRPPLDNILNDFNDPLASYMGRGRGKAASKKTQWNCSGAGYGRGKQINEYVVNIDIKNIPKILWNNPMLNSQQKDAVIRVLLGVARPLPYIIFGPPGTGKTVTVVEAILQVHSLIPQSRILVATPTNSAADLLACRLLESGNLQQGDFLRLLSYSYIEQGRMIASLVPYSAVGSFSDNEDYHEDVPLFKREQIKDHRVIVGTMGTLGILYNMGFPRGYFSHIFVDEAGQAHEPELMVLMTMFSPKTGHVILSGDPLQLGPVVCSQLGLLFGLNDSFLVRLLRRFPYVRDEHAFSNNCGFDPRLVTKLIQNYRSLDGILQIYNNLFYSGDLKTNISDNESEEAKLLHGLRSFDLKSPVLFHGVRGSNRQEPNSKSWYNPQEVFQVFCYLTKLYYDGVHPDLIGIITPYQEQVNKIKGMLESNNLETPKIGSVEEFQGQERMIIILSLVKSFEDSSDITNITFVTDPRRMNVAISRARALLIIIGDAEILFKNEYWHKIIKYCLKKESYVGCQLSSFHSEPEINNSSLV